MKCNISIIYNVIDRVPVGVICLNPISGDVSFSADDQKLIDTLDILLDNKLFLMRKENISDGTFIVEETVSLTDSYYIMALNYALPLPWWIMDTYEDSGDIEDLAKLYYKKICEGSDIDG